MSMAKPSIADLFARVVGDRPQIRFSAYDGSSVGPMDASVHMELTSPRALQYFATAYGDLGIARAFVSGDLEVHGDIHEALVALLPTAGQDISLKEKVEVLRVLGPWVFKRPAVPAEEASPPWRRGLRHSKNRDAAAISHHYDVSNEFYQYVLGPSMTYTCAVYPSLDASLETAQESRRTTWSHASSRLNPECVCSMLVAAGAAW